MNLKDNKMWFMIIAIVLCAVIVSFLFSDVYYDSVFGKSKNELRLKLRVPLIDSEMKPSYKLNKSGGKWQGEDFKKGVVHVWKILTPGLKKYKLHEEIDMYRCYLSECEFWQLNLTTNIINDSAILRSSLLRKSEKGVFGDSVSLSDIQLDSVLKKWNLNYLVVASNVGSVF